MIPYLAGPAVGTPTDAGGGSAGFWAVVVGLVLVLLVAASLRVVPVHERAVVSRSGRIIRVGGPGVVFLLPVLERVTRVSLDPVHMPLVVSATTRDGVRVRVLATAQCRVRDPALSTLASPDPLSATASAVETALGAQVASRTLSALLRADEQLESRMCTEASAASAAWGVEVTGIEVTDVETRLTPDLLRKVQRQ